MKKVLIKSSNFKTETDRQADACTHTHAHECAHAETENDWGGVLAGPTLCSLNKELKLRLYKVTLALQQICKTTQQSQSFSTWVSWDQDS